MKRFILICAAICGLLESVKAQSWETEHARSLIGQERYVEAAKVLRPLAEAGDAEAQYLASSLFFEGKGVVKNPDQAMKYLAMAAKQYHIGATMQYVLKSGKTTGKEKLIAIIEDCFEHNPKALNSQLVYCFYLLDDDKEKGWQLIANSATTDKGDNMMSKTDVLEYLDAAHKSFYQYLIDTYITDPRTLRNKMLSEYLYSATREKGFQWAHEAVFDIVGKLRDCDAQTQLSNYEVWKRESSFRLFRSISACIDFMGLGRASNLEKARATAMELTLIMDDGSDPWIKKTMRLILDSYDVGIIVGPNIKVVKVENGNVTVDNGNGTMTMQSTELTDIILKQEKKKANFEKRKSAVKVISTRQGIAVDSNPHIEYKNGELNLMFVVKTKTPNNVRFVVKSAGCTKDTRFDKVTYEVIGLERRSSLMVIPPNKQIYVTVKVKGAPRTGEFRQLAVQYDSDYGSGNFIVNNLAW